MLDFEQSSLVEPVFLVTIISEAVLKDSIVLLLKSLKVKSYTVSQVQGEGRAAKSLPSASDEEAESHQNTVEMSVEIRAIASSELSNVILYALKEQQRNFVIVAYRQQVEALIDE